ncbi:MAG: OmpA family protein [Brevinematales bacterium]|nr:OmpA family protein [Brevinematales bacterium]
MKGYKMLFWLCFPLWGIALSLPDGSERAFLGYGVSGQAAGYTGISDDSAWVNPALYNMTRLHTGFSVEGIGREVLYRVEGGIPTSLGHLGARVSYLGGQTSLFSGEILWSRAISRWFSLGVKIEGGGVNGGGFLMGDVGMVQRGGEGRGIGFYHWDYGLVVKNIGVSTRLSDGTPWKPLGIMIGGGFSPLVFDGYELRLQSDGGVSVSPFSLMWGVGMKHTFFDAVLVSAGYQFPLGGVGLPVGGGYMMGVGLRGGFAVDRKNTNLLVRLGKTPSSEYTEVHLWYGLQGGTSLSHGLMVSVAWGQYDDTPPVVQTNPVIFFSPNVDGVKDEAAIPLFIADNGKLSGWEVEIVDEKNTIIRKFQSWQPFESRSLSLKQIFERLVTPDRGIEVPSSVIWDGRDAKGNVLPDGRYRYRIRAKDLNENETLSSWQTIVLDTFRREVAASLSSPLFSPNGDAIQDVLVVSLTNVKSLPGDRLLFAVMDAKQSPVFQSAWTNEEGLPLTLAWDGTGKSGPVPEGMYEVSVKLESEAGNTAFFSAPVRLVRTIENVLIVPSKEAFSARKGDVFILTPRVSSEEWLTNWRLMIQDAGGRVIWYQSGKSPLPSTLTWDGRDQKGNVCPDGRYTARLQLFYESGNQPLSEPVSVVLDNTPPLVSVRLPYTIFSPLPDSRQRTLPMAFDIQASSNDRVTLSLLDEGGRVVFYDQKPASEWPSSLEWTGLDARLSPLPEGKYTVVLEAEDAVGHRAQTNVVVTLRTGRERLSVTTSQAYVSPRLQSDVLFAIEGNPTGIKILEFTLRGEDNRLVYSLTTNQWLSRIKVPLGNLRDGTYTYQATALYEDGQNPQSSPKTLEVDSVPPRFSPSLERPAFSPNGDGRRDVLVIEAKPEGRSNDTYSMLFLDSSGRIVRSVEWRGPLFSRFVWNGQDNQGKDLPEGFYHIQTVSRDASSNTTVEWISNVVLVRAFPALEFEVNDTVLVPGRIPLLVTGKTTETNRIELNELQFLDQQGKVFYQMSTNIWKKEWIWRGENEGGGVVPDGYYTVRWNLTYLDGNYIRAELEDIIVDSQPPRVTVAFSPLVFTPDGDGENDVMEIGQGFWDLAGLSSFTTSIHKVRENMAPLLIKRWTKSFADPLSLWEEKVSWNGIGDDGELVESVQDYTLTVQAVDIVGHTNTYQTNFTTGVLVERTPDGLRIRMSSIRFALNSATLTPQSQQNLNRVIEVFQRLFTQPERYGLTKDFFIEVSGHTDDLPGPTPTFNKQLSERRAKAVYDYLVARGIPAEKLVWAGYGESRPYKAITPEMTKDQRDEIRSRNRRVEFFIRKKR